MVCSSIYRPVLTISTAVEAVALSKIPIQSCLSEFLQVRPSQIHNADLSLAFIDTTLFITSHCRLVCTSSILFKYGAWHTMSSLQPAWPEQSINRIPFPFLFAMLARLRRLPSAASMSRRKSPLSSPLYSTLRVQISIRTYKSQPDVTKQR